MAWMLVTLASVKQSLRIDHDDDDGLLILLISAASRRVVQFVKGEAGEIFGIDSPPNTIAQSPNSPPDDISLVSEEIQAAINYLVGVLYSNPDGDAANNFSGGELPRPVKALLKTRRVPTIA